MPKAPISQTFQDYLVTQPEKTQSALRQLRDCILKAAPESTELINYNIPAFALVEGGKREQQIMIAGYQNHVGLYPHPSVMEKYADALKDYKQGKGFVQFPLNKPLPASLIIDMVKYRMELLNQK